MAQAAEAQQHADAMEVRLHKERVASRRRRSTTAATQLQLSSRHSACAASHVATVVHPEAQHSHAPQLSVEEADDSGEEADLVATLDLQRHEIMALKDSLYEAQTARAAEADTCAHLAGQLASVERQLREAQSAVSGLQQQIMACEQRHDKDLAQGTLPYAPSCSDAEGLAGCQSDAGWLLPIASGAASVPASPGQGGHVLGTQGTLPVDVCEDVGRLHDEWQRAWRHKSSEAAELADALRVAQQDLEYTHLALVSAQQASDEAGQRAADAEAALHRMASSVRLERAATAQKVSSSRTET
jgi:hypothetical protein